MPFVMEKMLSIQIPLIVNPEVDKSLVIYIMACHEPCQLAIA